MKVVLFDAIEELHVATTLRDALRRRGHDVVWTGSLWQGYELPTDPVDVRRLDAVVDDVLAWGPDAVLTLRAASLTPANLERLRDAGARLLAWFNDDPVLFGVSTAALAPLYDVTLHSGGPEVLALYEARTGVRGVTFPFYADPATFPYRYRARSAGRDAPAAAVFLGNTHTRQKQWRYAVLAGSGIDVVIYGKVRGDRSAFALHAGYLASEAEVAATLPRFKVGISIAQRFADYRGTPYDYPGLAELGWYSLPSRVVQMAAVGLPIIDYRPDGPGPADVPTVEVRDEGVLSSVVSELSASRRQRARMSLAGYEWFLDGYTADSRAAFVESLVSPSGAVQAESLPRRAQLYREFGAQSRITARTRVSARWG